MSYRTRQLRKSHKPATVTRGAKALLAECGYLGLPEGILGTGKNGNITKADVVNFLDNRSLEEVSGIISRQQEEEE